MYKRHRKIMNAKQIFNAMCFQLIKGFFNYALSTMALDDLDFARLIAVDNHLAKTALLCYHSNSTIRLFPFSSHGVSLSHFILELLCNFFYFNFLSRNENSFTFKLLGLDKRLLSRFMIVAVFRLSLCLLLARFYSREWHEMPRALELNRNGTKCYQEHIIMKFEICHV